MPDGERTRTAVVDVTYACNASCRYCRWGDPRSGGRARPAAEAMIPAATLREMGTQKVVLSGGEPRLHPGLRVILNYYRALVPEVVVITNGYGLGVREAASLAGAGATGITVSLDSADPAASFAARATPPAVHAAVLRAVRGVAAMPGGPEVGINATVSAATASWASVDALLSFAEGAGAAFVKFQPVFDDGYASSSAPHLMLGPDDAPALLDIAARLSPGRRPQTNPPQFWRDVAELAAGGRLPGGGCALDGSDAILTGRGLAICYWVGGSYHGGGGPAAAAARLARAKRRCTVGYRCFCNQGIAHAWR